MGLRLGIDMDGVIADFNAGWMRHFNAQHGTDLHPDMVDSWHALPGLTGLADMPAFWDWARDLGEGYSIFRHLDPFPGAIESLHALNAAGHDIIIVTAKPDWSVPDTLAWLADHRVPVREVHIRHDKWEVDADVYLDDAPHVLRGYRRHRPDAEILRFVRRWNHPIEGTHDVHGWDDVIDRVTAIAADARAA
jgi:5'(3')-deoxyribonucleotidase